MISDEYGYLFHESGGLIEYASNYDEEKFPLSDGNVFPPVLPENSCAMTAFAEPRFIIDSGCTGNLI